MSSLLRALSVRTNFSIGTSTSTVPPPYSLQRPPRYTLNVVGQAGLVPETPHRPKEQVYATPRIFFRALGVILALSSVVIGAASSTTSDKDGADDFGTNPAVLAVVSLSGYCFTAAYTDKGSAWDCIRILCDRNCSSHFTKTVSSDHGIATA